jgi:hypothetical protein
VVSAVELNVQLALSNLMAPLTSGAQTAIKRKTKKDPKFLPVVGSIHTLLNFKAPVMPPEPIKTSLSYAISF